MCFKHLGFEVPCVSMWGKKSHKQLESVPEKQPGRDLNPAAMHGTRCEGSYPWTCRHRVLSEPEKTKNMHLKGQQYWSWEERRARPAEPLDVSHRWKAPWLPEMLSALAIFFFNCLSVLNFLFQVKEIEIFKKYS